MEQSLSSYRIFYVVALEGNISRAAERLFISQPAISRSIRKLEDSLETTLFLRSSRGVVLTEEGKILFDHVKEAFDAHPAWGRTDSQSPHSWHGPSAHRYPAPLCANTCFFLI